MADTYAQEVAARVIEAMEAGTAPWQKPWAPGEQRAPYNPTTGKPYRGMNSLWLQLQGQGDPRWLTYKQAAAEGAQVRGGSRGTRIEYWKFRDEQVKRDETGAPVLDAQGQPVKIQVELDRPRRFTAVVFNAAQIDGLAPLPVRVLQPEPARHDRAEAILSNSRAAIRHVPGDRAYYSPGTDSIILPERQQFKGPDAYYATALHELGHWTGHASRLDRDLAHPFGSEGYAREELRAEIASLMLGEQLEIGHDPGQHAAYVKSWIKVLQDDPAEIFRAASAAEKINTYVMSFEHERALAEDRTETLTPAASNEKFASPAAMGGPETGATSEPMTTERTYLAVPYSEKDGAKRLGAKWDKVAKSWYAPEGTQLRESGLAQWLPMPESTTNTPEVARPQELFADALRAHGLVLEGEPVMDGRLYRVQVEGDRGSERSGAYVGHLDGTVPAGFVQNYKTGAAENWRYPADAVAPLTEEERAEVRASATATRQRREAQRQEAQDKARTAARALWGDAPGAPDDNAYCVKKSIANPAIKRLRVVPDAASAGAQEIGIRIANSGPEAKAMRAAEPEAWVFNKGDLLVPLYGAEGLLEGLQTINPTFKGFMRGARKAGLYSVAGGDPESFVAGLAADPAMPIVLAEGYATGDTLAEALGHPVIVALDSGNLDAVARHMRKDHPDRALIFGADNDPRMVNGHPQNVGLEKATAAAKAHGGGVAAPIFAPGQAGSDWNDYAQNEGWQVAKGVIRDQIEAAKLSAAIAAEKLRYFAHERMADAVDNPATSLDNQFVASERDEAQTTIIGATGLEAAVMADADNLAADIPANTSVAAVDMSTLVQRGQDMADALKQERIEVLDGTGSSATADPEVEQAVQRQRGLRRGRGR